MLQRETRADAPLPVALSVVIPVYNAASDLERCLTALEASTFTDWEVVVVDDGSTDGSGEVARRHGAQLVVLKENGGQARARNRGALVARGPVLLFIDADVYVHADTFTEVVAAFAADPNLAALIGSYDDRPAAPSFLSQYKNLFHHYVHQRGKTEASTFWSGCGAIRRSLFLAMGGFNEEFRAIEDIELGFRLRQAGHRIHLEKHIQATHGKRWRFWNLLGTDVFRRGVPWVALMIRDRRMTCDLNLAWRDRCCAALTYLLTGNIALILSGHGITPWADWSPIAFLAAILALQYDFYRFFIRRRGGLFALGVLPMHLLYYLYGGAAIPLGTMAYLCDQWRGSRSGARSVGKVGRLAGTWAADAPPRAENLAPVAADRESA